MGEGKQVEKISSNKKEKGGMKFQRKKQVKREGRERGKSTNDRIGRNQELTEKRKGGQ